jgi:phosphatidylinositol 4-kinase type 2
LGLNSGLKPKLTEDGTSGTYELRNHDKKKIAIFKPIDEEPYAPNNPRTFIGSFGSQTFRKGVLSGEACVREVVAYMLDTRPPSKGYSCVPPTAFVELMHHYFKYIPFTGQETTSKEY